MFNSASDFVITHRDKDHTTIFYSTTYEMTCGKEINNKFNQQKTINAQHFKNILKSIFEPVILYLLNSFNNI